MLEVGYTERTVRAGSRVEARVRKTWAPVVNRMVTPT